MLKITAHESIEISAPPEKVWDYTQNWNHRREWDDSVLEVIRYQTEPHKRVKARFAGGMTCEIEYKLNDRPHKTTLVMLNSTSRWFTGGGGSWRYDATPAQGTLWVQTNTLVLADHWVMRALRPVLQAGVRSSTRRAMKKAKRIIEGA